MESLTVRQAAEKWGLSPRTVQQLCIQGRIPGAQKFGKAWAIPANTARPKDLRRNKQEPTVPPPDLVMPDAPFTMMPQMNTPFPPGQCRKTMQRTLADGEKLSPNLRAAVSFVAAGAAVLLHLPLPEDLRRILDVTYRFSWGWRRIHNPDTGHDVADNLTTTEFAVAMLTAQGWTGREIAAHMNVSPNTVKRHLAEIKKKLGISNRKELKQYMLR